MIAEMIRARRDALIAEWTKAERTYAERVRHLPLDELIDSLPDLLDEIADHLESHFEDARRDAPSIVTAEEHGEQRVELRIPAECMIEEYAMLRRILTRAIARESTAPEPGELEQMHALLDLSVQKSVSAHRRRDDVTRMRLLAIVSHDLRNPLNAIVLGAAALKRRLEEADAQRAALVKRIHDSGERALRMISDLLDYSQATFGGEIPVRPTEVDIVPVVEHIVEELRAAFPQRTVALEIAQPSVVGKWDADRLAQVLGNLVRNGLQHSVEKTTVVVRVESDDAQVTIGVHNEGAPISPNVLPRIFDAFERGDARDQRAGNIGLGLYITQQIVRSHGGRVSVVSDERNGTLFRVVLPRGLDDG
jgi:signal transduction histidine kinase